MRQFLIALQFLTVIPVKINAKIDEKEFGASLLFFPIVGLLIGMILVLVKCLFGFLPDTATSVLILITSILITGGIHLDGFADTCDGLYGNKTKEESLNIMRDSRIGVMGVTGLILLILLKFSLLVSISDKMLWKILIFMPLFARWTQVLSCFLSGYARSNGKAKNFLEYVTKREFVLGGLFSFIIALFLIGIKGLGVFMLSLLPILLFIKFVKKKIGGMTGDTIGAVNEIAEVLTLFSFVYLYN